MKIKLLISCFQRGGGLRYIASKNMKKKSPDAFDIDSTADALRESANFVRAARAASGLGPEEFAKRARVSRQTIWLIESGSNASPPRVNTLARIAKAAGRHLKIALGS